VVLASIEVIGESPFGWCKSLELVIFEVEPNLQAVGSDAFEGRPSAASGGSQGKRKANDSNGLIGIEVRDTQCQDAFELNPGARFL
jgi:hypothetical protein